MMRMQGVVGLADGLGGQTFMFYFSFLAQVTRLLVHHVLSPAGKSLLLCECCLHVSYQVGTWCSFDAKKVLSALKILGL